MPLPLLAGLGAIAPIASEVIKRIFPDPIEREKAEAELAQMQLRGELQFYEARLSAIIAEAKSEDPWTSRARPSFLYVIYTLILAAIPMGVLHAFQPETAASIAEGFKQWLAAIPTELYTLFGVGYLGYTGAREYGKKQTTEANKQIISQTISQNESNPSWSSFLPGGGRK